MGKRSNGKLRVARNFERALRKGVLLLQDPHAYVFATDGTRLSPVYVKG